MRIKALQPFSHQDRAYQIGDSVEVSESAGKWLIAQGVAVETQADKPDKPDKAGNQKSN